MAIATAELVLFALRAGVRLGRAARTAYVDSIRMREIALPIPNAGFTLDVIHARTYFNEEGTAFVAEDARLAALHARAVARTLPEHQGDPERDEYMDLYLYYRSITIARRQRNDVPLVAGPALDPDALLAMFRFQQWEREDPDRPKPMRRVLGAIIDVGVDYFASVPGAIAVDTRHQRTLTAFVRAVDQLDFEQIALQEEPLAALMGQLLVAALETISEQPEFLASDPNVRDLVSVTTTALATDIAARLEQAGTTDEADDIRAWGELVFRSVLRSGARHVLEHPGTLLGVESDAHQALVSRIGIATIDLVTADNGLHPERLFSGQGVQTVIAEALAVVADHPHLITDTDNAGVTALIQAIAG
ncbi:MAG: hypothetical protein KDA21_06095, partial [Phycisphaerales bacterium]|nr:hypothetical protein [Phycisphaerales bacterium]